MTTLSQEAPATYYLGGPGRKSLQAHFLTREEHDEYTAALEMFTGKARNSLDVKRNNSNIWQILLLNQIGITTATLPELELARDSRMPLEEGQSIGREIILVNTKGSIDANWQLAQSLAEKLKIRDWSNPYIVKGLKIVQNDSFYEGLDFDTRNAEVIKAPNFHYSYNPIKFRTINHDYTIIKPDNTTKRTVYLPENGIATFTLTRYADINVGSQELTAPYLGRAVVITPLEERAESD